MRISEPLLYYLSIAVCGGTLGIVGLSELVSGEVTLVSVLFTVSGVGVVLGTIYEGALSDDPAESVPGSRQVWFTTTCAVLVIVGAAWAVVT